MPAHTLSGISDYTKCKAVDNTVGNLAIGVYDHRDLHFGSNEKHTFKAS